MNHTELPEIITPTEAPTESINASGKSRAVRLVFAILVAGLVPCFFDLLYMGTTDILYTWGYDLLYSSDLPIYGESIIDIISSSFSLLYNVLPVVITSVLCAVLLKSITSGIAAYGCSVIVFSLTGIVNSAVYTLTLYGLPYSVYNVIRYAVTVISPVFICLLFALANKIKAKQRDSKKKFIIKLVLAGIFSIAYPLTSSLVSAIGSLISSLFSSYDTETYNKVSDVIYFTTTSLSALLLIAGLIIFLCVFKDGLSYTAAIACYAIPLSLQFGSIVYNILWLLAYNDYIDYDIITIGNVIVSFLQSLFVFSVIPVMFILFILIPALRKRKKEKALQDETEKEENGEEIEIDPELEEMLDDIKADITTDTHYQYSHSETKF